MASIVLSVAGTSIGSAAGGPFLGLLGSQIGSQIGSKVDDVVFGPIKISGIRGGRLSDLAVQTSTYGKMIPIVYGTVRIAGNIIWARPIKEVVNTTTSSAGGGKGGGGGKVTSSQTSYAYYATLAIAVCEGRVDDVLRVWADGAQIDVTKTAVTYRVYRGGEAQLPDPLIESFEGVGKTPAYRGTSYVVIEDFPLEDYGNRIPNFTFEVKKSVLSTDSSGDILENMIKHMVMIPGSGEFVYDTQVQYKISGEQVGPGFITQGKKTRINQNSRESKADTLVALDQLKKTCPNVEWISLVVTWYGDNMDAGNCVIKPGVEYKTGGTTEPEIWSVGSFTRASAKQITIDGNGNPVYGGTPDDQSVLRYLTELRARGYKIVFYPLFFMDVPNKPWRGRVTGTPTNVSNFFTKTNGYNAFINHYANLVNGYVDAFIIGSEMIGLTTVNDGSNNFPAVTQLVNLAATVKGVLGSGVKVGYAADWTEYHHTTGGWYHMDPLWSSPNIDIVGIDAYFPLTDELQKGYDLQKVMDGWTSGEGYDFVYTDVARTIQAPIAPQYAWKNIAWWWSNSHVNPNGATTAWVPESKKIWFTEYGFPSVDGATNQPNVFYDPSSSESFFPRFSKGRVDFRAQRLGLFATEKKWKNSSMIERMFVWTWDARPYPYWPDLGNVWTDGGLWKTGHWVEGKLGLSTLGAVVSDLCRRVGMDDEVDTTRLLDLVEGFVLTNRTSARDAIEDLQKAYFFDAVESDYLVKFTMRTGISVADIAEQELASNTRGDATDLMAITRRQELELPKKIEINYYNRLTDYQVATQRSERQVVSSVDSRDINLPMVLPDQQAKTIADVTLFNSWQERTAYKFELPYKYLRLEPTDVVKVTVNGVVHTIRITDTHYGNPGVIRVTGIAEDPAVYDFYSTPGENTPVIQVPALAGDTSLEFLDLPAFPNDSADQAFLRLAAVGEEAGWVGAVIYRSDDAGSSFGQIASIGTEAVIGSAATVLGAGTVNVFDRVNMVTVILREGTLSGTTELAVLNGANTALLGEEVLQFATATFVSEGKYVLSNLLRGRLGTEDKISGHVAGERFVLLDSAIQKVTMPTGLFGLARTYKPVSVGETLGATDAVDFAYRARALKPYSPVYIVGSRNTGGDLTVSWKRRTRVGGDWRDGVDAALSETSEHYEVEVMSGATVKRTITGLTAPSASYSAADQVTDFGAAQSAVSVRIYQISSAVGRGNAGIGVV